MVSLLVTTCVLGLVCKEVESPVAYDDVESCFSQAAMIAAKTATERQDGSDKYAWRADCTTKFDFGDEIGFATVSTTGEHGAELPDMFKLRSELGDDQEADAEGDDTEADAVEESGAGS